MNKFCKVYNCRFPWSHTTVGHECGKCHNFGHGQYECCHSSRIKNLNTSVDELPAQMQCTMAGCKYKKYHVSLVHKCKICKNNHSSRDCPEQKKEEDTIYIIECPMCKILNHISRNQPKIYGVDELCCVCADNKINLFLPKCGHVCLCLDCADKLNKKPKKEYEKEIMAENGLSEEIKKIALDKFNATNSKVYTICPMDLGCCMYIRRFNNTSRLEGFFMHYDDWGQYGIDTDKTPMVKDFINGYNEVL